MMTTFGMVLLRESYREYDERILFYTERLGKVWIYSFGSRSPRSLRGQRLGEFGWLKLELEGKDNRYRLQEVERIDPVRDYQKSKEYFLGWGEFLRDLSKRIPHAAPTPKIFSLISLLSGPEPASWPQSFREFTWYSSALIELGIFPNFSQCRQCGKFCSDWYFFSLPGEVVGSSCISKLKSPHENWLPERLALEDVFFLNYCRKNYIPDLSFFKKAFALTKKLSDLPDQNDTSSSQKLSIHWEHILPVLKTIMKE